MKFWKSAIRIWFTFVSLITFMIGWAVLAHSPKPNQFKASDVPPMPELKPVPSLEQIMFAGEQQNSSIRIVQRTAFMRTRGS